MAGPAGSTRREGRRLLPRSKQTRLAPASHYQGRDSAARARRADEALQDFEAQGDHTSTFRAAIRSKRGGLIRSAAVAFSGVGPTAEAAADRELPGRTTLSESTFRQAGKRARAEVEPISDVRGSSQYRLQLAEKILLKFYQEIDRRSARRPPLANKCAADLTGQASGRALCAARAASNVTGRTLYLDDLPPFRNELSIELVVSPLAPRVSFL